MKKTTKKRKTKRSFFKWKSFLKKLSFSKTIVSLTIVNDKPSLTIVNDDPSLIIVNDVPLVTIVNDNPTIVNEERRREGTDLKGFGAYH